MFITTTKNSLTFKEEKFEVGLQFLTSGKTVWYATRSLDMNCLTVYYTLILIYHLPRFQSDSLFWKLPETQNLRSFPCVRKPPSWTYERTYFINWHPKSGSFRQNLSPFSCPCHKICEVCSRMSPDRFSVPLKG